MPILKNKLFVTIFLFSILFTCISIPSYAATKEYIVSGDLSEQLDIPAGTTKVILDGVNGDSDSIIVIPNEAEIFISDKSENNIGAIQGQGFLTVTGGGNLTVEKTILNMGFGIDFRHTGKITIENGSIIAVGDDISFFDGEVFINSKEGVDSSLFILSGNGLMFGGKLTINSLKIGIDIQNGFEMQGGDLYIKTENGSAIIVANSGEGEVVFDEGVSINDNFNSITVADEYGNNKKILMTSDKKQAKFVEAHGSYVNETETLDYLKTTESTEGKGRRVFLGIVIFLIIVLLIVGIVKFIFKRDKNENNRN